MTKLQPQPPFRVFVRPKTNHPTILGPPTWHAKFQGFSFISGRNMQRHLRDFRTKTHPLKSLQATGIGSLDRDLLGM